MTVHRAPGGIGARLREAREQRGLSVRQLAGTTKISGSVLEALERNDISRLPGGIFGRAFVRAYAQEVGLDPEEIVREFITQFPTETVTAGHPATRTVEDREAVDSAERTAWTLGRLAIASIPLVALVLYMTGLGRTSDRTAGTGSQEQILIDSRPVPALPAMPLPVVAEVSDQGPVVLWLEARGSCWVSVEVDGQVVLQRELQAGDRERFEVERDFSIRAGNAGVLALSLDGREIRSLGGAGQVVSFSASRDNFERFLANP